MSPISPAASGLPFASRMRTSESRTGRPTLPWCSIHSSPRMAVTPRPSLMPSAIITLSGPLSLTQRSTRYGVLGEGRHGTFDRPVDPRAVFLAEVDLAVDRIPEPAELPLRQIPPHRYRYGTELPRGEGREHELRGVAQPDAEAVAQAEPALG